MIQNADTVKTDLQDLRTASPFRIWVMNLWMENREERLLFREDPVTMKQYWDTCKWWVKREYKYQRQK
jgi:hypothetical protein